MQVKMAEKPLFCDLVYHGAADPTVIWNQKEQKWFMFYTNRLANVKGLDGVSWLNSVKTIDIVHYAGFSIGNIGFQLLSILQLYKCRYKIFVYQGNIINCNCKFLND